MPIAAEKPKNQSTSRSSLKERDFMRLSKLIQDECGIKMPPSKKVMLQSRLQKRLRQRGMTSFSEYCDYLFSPCGSENEITHLIDAVTTNKTDFYREPRHFEYLEHNAVPELMGRHGAGIKRELLVWSAGCSTGEEPYTLAMVLNEFSAKKASNSFRYTVLATDISTRVLEKASLGIYEYDKIIPVPESQRKKYLLRSRDKDKGLFRIVPELRKMVKFQKLNFLEGDFGIRRPIDIIFCRNVIIYFDKTTQEIVLNRFRSHLTGGGYIFLGHSETLHGLDVPLVQVAPTVYRRTP